MRSATRTGREILSYHCYQSKVSLFFQVGFDELQTSSRRLANRLNEEALADSELYARVIRTQLSVKACNQPEEQTCAYEKKRTRLMHRYTVLSKESVSPSLLL